MANESNQQATLGCGTLILIGLVVLFFTRPGIREIETEVKELRGEVKALRKAVDAQTKMIEGMQAK
jgi:hypothetical protein